MQFTHMEIRKFRSKYKLELITNAEWQKFKKESLETILNKAGLEASVISEGSHAHRTSAYFQWLMIFNTSRKCFTWK